MLYVRSLNRLEAYLVVRLDADMATIVDNVETTAALMRGAAISVSGDDDEDGENL